MNLHKQIAKRKKYFENISAQIVGKAHERDALNLPHNPTLPEEILKRGQSVAKLNVGDVVLDVKCHYDNEWQCSMVGVVTRIKAGKVFIKEYRCPYSVSYRKKDFQFQVIPKDQAEDALKIYEEFCKANKL